MLRLSLIVLAVMGILVSAEVWADEAPAQTSVCELAKAGKAMDGRRIRLRAVFVSDLMHSSVLKDRGCPTEGVSPLQAEGAMQDQSAEKFNNAMWGKPEDHELRISGLTCLAFISGERARHPMGV
jgi:hypothetical protein